MTRSITDQLRRFEYSPGKKDEKTPGSGSSPNASPSKLKAKKRQKTGYAPPEKYAHLEPLTPLLQDGLRCVFIGYNPGTTTALKGHYYAHPTNLFWKLMYQSGVVDREVTYMDDRLLPDEFGIGLTDLVDRPTTGVEELSPSEMTASVPTLEAKISGCRPGMVCIVGKGIWDTIYRHKHGRRQKRTDFEWGLQIGENLGGCGKVFVVPSTSGLVAGVSRDVKLKLWKQVADYLHTNFPPNPCPCPCP